MKPKTAVESGLIIGMPTIWEMLMRTIVKFAVYRNGAKICQSTRTFTGNVTSSFAKREIAKAHGVAAKDVEIIEITRQK